MSRSFAAFILCTSGVLLALAKDSGTTPQFTAAQVAAGGKAYNAECASCHGNALNDGTAGPPLTGEYFKTNWAGKPLSGYFEASRQMPPGSPGALSDATIAGIVAYVLEANGYKAGPEPLPTNRDVLRKMIIR